MALLPKGNNMIFNSKQMVIVIALLSAPYIHPMEQTVKASGSVQDAQRILQASSDLLQAARDGNMQRVQAALAAGADVNHQDIIGSTPLFCAASSGHKEIVELLIHAGADKDRQTSDGSTPLLRAAERGHKEIVELLIRAGANIDHQDSPRLYSFALGCCTWS